MKRACSCSCFLWPASLYLGACLPQSDRVSLATYSVIVCLLSNVLVVVPTFSGRSHSLAAWSHSLEPQPGALTWSLDLEPWPGALAWSLGREPWPGALAWSLSLEPQPGALAWSLGLEPWPEALAWSLSLEPWPRAWLIQTLENLENTGKKISLEKTGKTQGKTVLLWKNEILSPT